MIRLLNSTVMPQPGTYSLIAITADEFAIGLQDADLAGLVDSYIGYQQTADHIRDLSGVTVRLNRERTELEDGDTLLIVRPGYRVSDPGTKAGLQQDPQWEYFACRYRAT